VVRELADFIWGVMNVGRQIKKMEDGGMSGETAGFIPGSIKKDPRNSHRVPGVSLTPAVRLRRPMIRVPCSNQHANIRLIMRRGQFPFSFRYQGFTLGMKKLE
jgi:hypothetical protein